MHYHYVNMMDMLTKAKTTAMAFEADCVLVRAQTHSRDMEGVPRPDNSIVASGHADILSTDIWSGDRPHHRPLSYR